MIECSLAQGSKSEREVTGERNHPCRLCLAGSPLSLGILYLYYGVCVTGLFMLSYVFPIRTHHVMPGFARYTRLPWVG
jgi:hypothetical protein